MKLISHLACLFLLVAPAAYSENVVIAEDDASQGAYNNGWNGDTNGGSGFEGWALQCHQTENQESHAGFFVATSDQNLDMGVVAQNNKAFGFFANGIQFETATAFRKLAKPLQVGDSFSFVFKAGAFKQKFDSDSPEPGAVGLTLRNGNSNVSPDSYNSGARFEFGYYEGEGNFQIYDGETKHDSGIPWSDSAISVTFTLVTADTYELEVTVLEDKKTTKLEARKLGGTAKSTIESFCAFDRDGETSDAYFNGFQVARPAK